MKNGKSAKRGKIVARKNVKRTRKVAKSHPRKSGPAFVGPARRPFGVTKGPIVAKELREDSAGGRLAIAMKQNGGVTEEYGATIARQQKGKATFGQKMSHLRYDGYDIVSRKATTNGKHHKKGDTLYRLSPPGKIRASE